MADSKGSSGKGSAPKPGSGNIGNIGPKSLGKYGDLKPIR